jgi:hypothetical protein
MLASQRKAEPWRLHLGWTLIQVHFDMEYPLRFLKAVAKVSIYKDGMNRPWRL